MSGEQWGEAVERALQVMYGDHPHAENYRAHVQVGIAAAAELIVADTRRKVAEEIEAERIANVAKDWEIGFQERGWNYAIEQAAAIARGSGNGDSGQEPEACASGTESDRDGRDPTDACQRTQ